MQSFRLHRIILAHFQSGFYWRPQSRHAFAFQLSSILFSVYFIFFFVYHVLSGWMACASRSNWIESAKYSANMLRSSKNSICHPNRWLFSNILHKRKQFLALISVIVNRFFGMGFFLMKRSRFAKWFIYLARF